MDTFGIVFFLSHCATLLVLSRMDMIAYDNDQIRTLVFGSVSIANFVYGCFFNMRVCIDVPTRITLNFITMGVLIIGLNKTRQGEFSASSILIYYFLLSTTIYESFFFVNLRSKAKLFLRSEVTKLQEMQLKNLLNTVPDKVMICE